MCLRLDLTGNVEYHWVMVGLFRGGHSEPDHACISLRLQKPMDRRRLAPYTTADLGYTASQYRNPDLIANYSPRLGENLPFSKNDQNGVERANTVD